MARWRRYDEEYSITTTISIPDEGECWIETRYAGHLRHSGRISRLAAENAVEKYGFLPVKDR